MSDKYHRMPNDPKQPVEMKEMKMAQYDKVIDQNLDQAIEVFKGVTNDINNMSDEVTKQNEKLDNLNNKTDKTTNNMKKANDLIQSYLNSASNCCLYSYIAIALFIFLVLVSI